MKNKNIKIPKGILIFSKSKDFKNKKSMKLLLSILVVSLFSINFIFAMNGNGSLGNPYQITNWSDLNLMRYNVSASYILMNDLSSLTLGYIGIGNDWTVVGNESNDYIGFNWFSGTFDGNGHTISDLIVTTCGWRECGLFGESDGIISNVGMINTTILADSDSAGSLLGYNYGIVSNCLSFANISGGFATGGLVGYNDNYYGEGIIIDSYSFGNVHGIDNAGGLVGFNTGTITDSLAVGFVNATPNYLQTSDIGGIVGESAGTVVESFYDLNVSGLSDNDRGTPKTTDELQNISTFENWNITLVSSNLNHGYPFLAWQNNTHNFVWLIHDFRITQEEIPQQHSNDVVFNTLVSSGAGLGRFIQLISMPLFIFLILLAIVGIIIFIGYTVANTIKSELHGVRK